MANTLPAFPVDDEEFDELDTLNYPVSLERRLEAAEYFEER